MVFLVFSEIFTNSWNLWKSCSFFFFFMKCFPLWHKLTLFYKQSCYKKLLVTSIKFLLVRSYFIFRLGNLLSHLKAEVFCLVWEHILVWPSNLTESYSKNIDIRLYIKYSLHFTYFLSKNEKPFKKPSLGKLVEI